MVHASAVSALRPHRALVVDDCASTRVLLRVWLEASGFDVEEAVDGEDAWDVIERSPVDLVLSDVRMPRLDGLELAERIRSSPRHASLLVVLVSAESRPSLQVEAAAVGADALLHKAGLELPHFRDMLAALLHARTEHPVTA